MIDRIFMKRKTTRVLETLRSLCIVSIAIWCIIPLSVRGATSHQQRSIYGTVYVDDEAVPGVSVKVKERPSVGTSTDLNGKFVLDVLDTDSILIISFVGHLTQEVRIDRQRSMDVHLVKDVQQIEEAVVVAYGTQKKTSVIGSVTSINPTELKVPSSNLTTALAGRLAGLIAYQRSGEPGLDNAEFFIRGATTFGYKVDPLIMIDGMEYSTTELARLNIDDIAGFSILKDATANALYGARGANGVILITTKEGREGKARMSIRLENSISSPTRMVEMADPITYMKLHNESILTRNPLGVARYPQGKIDNTEAGLNPEVFPALDWRKIIFKENTLNQRLNFNIHGGGQIATYYIAAAANVDKGNLKVDQRNNFNSNVDLKTYSLRSNINVRLTKSTESMIRMFGTFDDYTGPLEGGAEIYQKVVRSNPVLFQPYYTPVGDVADVNHILFGNYDTGNFLNPYADLVKGYREYSRTLMGVQYELKQDLSMLIPGLSLRGMLNTNRQAFFTLSRSYNPFYYRLSGYDRLSNRYVLNAINPETGTDYLSYEPGEKLVSSTFHSEAAANYNGSFGKSGVSAMLLFIARSSVNSNEETLQQSLPYRNATLGGRLTYDYDDRYFAEFNFGYNGSERFYRTERFGFFPSAGVAWNISNEPFFESTQPIINKLRLRANYGLVGNDAIGSADERFFYMSEINMNDPNYAVAFGRGGAVVRNGISFLRYENQAITWETAKNSTIGLELGLLNQLDLIAEYFFENRTNILMTRASIPKTLGLQGSVPKANVGKAKSRSLDISLNYNNTFSNGFYLSALGNLTYAKNEFVAYEEPIYANQWSYRAGRPIHQFYGYIAERLFVDDEEVRNSPTQIFGDQPTRGGDIKYRDIDNNGFINEDDMVPIGFPTVPEIVFGFGFSAKYKQVDFSLFAQGSGRSSFWMDPVATSPFVDDKQLLKAYAENHWSEDNSNNLYALWPRLSNVENGNNTQPSTWFLRDGSFIRLKQVEIGYTVPSTWLKSIGIDNFRLYMNGTNLAVWSGFDMWDIEMGGNGLGYPLQRVINFGLQLEL